MWPSHSAVFWLLPSLALRRRPALVACVWIHLLMDSYADGIVWLWPWRRSKVGLFRKPAEIVDDGWRTPAPLSTSLGRIEAAMWLGAALALIRRG